MEGGNPGSPGRPPARQQGQPALGHRRQSTQILCNPGSGRTAAPGAAPLSQRPGWSGPMIPPELLAPFQIGVLFLLIAIALAVFIAETLSIELTALSVIAVLVLFFHFFPIIGPDGENSLGLRVLLSGFAHPALIAVLGLLVLGEGLARTGVLDDAATSVIRFTRQNRAFAVALMLVVVIAFSAMLNNIPVVVLFIPIMQALTRRFRQPPSRYMMLLSFASMLGGMTTLIGSSTNLLVSLELASLGERPFGFFDFTIPGLVLAGSPLLVGVIAFSGRLNNLPVGVLFIPIMQALTRRFRQPPSRYMMLLSFASMLGGMTTLIGSSTNLLVSLELASLGERPFGFFDFTIPGLVLAGSGLCYLLLLARTTVVSGKRV